MQKRIESIKHPLADDDAENNLLQTIRIPKNLLVLTDKLPSSNYDKSKMKKFKDHNHNQKKLDPLVMKKALTEGNEIKEVKANKKIVLNINNLETSIGQSNQDTSARQKKEMKDKLHSINEEKKIKNNENSSNKRPPSKIKIELSSKHHDVDKEKGQIMLPVLKNISYERKEK